METTTTTTTKEKKLHVNFLNKAIKDVKEYNASWIKEQINLDRCINFNQDGELYISLNTGPFGLRFNEGCYHNSYETPDIFVTNKTSLIKYLRELKQKD